MARQSLIGWTDATFNPWLGCSKISPGCTHCYAEAWSSRYGMAPWGNHPRKRTSAANWSAPVRWNHEAEQSGRRPKVFCASLADVFDLQAPDSWRRDLFDLIARTPSLDWLVLTKRPENALTWCDEIGTRPNVWLGVSVEDQKRADERLPILRQIPAAIRFVSAEPLIEGVRLDLLGIDWVIVGGESGPGARAMTPDWARSIRDQCRQAGAAFFMKQLGGPRDKRHRLEDLPDDLRIREWPDSRRAVVRS